MIVPVMAISNLVLTQQIYSEETNGAHAHYREPVPLKYTDKTGESPYSTASFPSLLRSLGKETAYSKNVESLSLRAKLAPKYPVGIFPI